MDAREEGIYTYGAWYGDNGENPCPIESNDPTVTAVEVIFGIMSMFQEDFSLGRWLRLWRNIGRSTVVNKLKLSLHGLNEEWVASETIGALSDDCSDKLHYTMGSTESMNNFCTELAKNRSLQLLSIDHFNFSRARFENMLPFIVDNNNLAELRLKNCRLSAHDVQTLADAFGQRKSPASIKTIGLSGDEINDEFAGGIADICWHCPELTTLSLSDCQIGDETCKQLAPLLANPDTSLKSLSLDNNLVTDVGASDMADALSGNRTLTKLDLSGCDGIQSYGWQDFLEILVSQVSANETFDSNHTLEDLGHGVYGLQHKKLKSDLLCCLVANQSQYKFAASNMKIAKFNLGEEFDVFPFTKSPTAVLTKVLEWISCYEFEKHRSWNSYRVIRYFPELCSYPSREKLHAMKLENENASQKKKIEELMKEIAELKSNKRQKC